jgi:hypothetical protein
MGKPNRPWRDLWGIRSSKHVPTGPENGANTSAANSDHSATTHPKSQTSSLSPSSTVVVDSGDQEATQKPKRKAVDIPPDELWHQAYDDLKTEEPELLKGYERLLSTVLPLDQTSKVIDQSQQNKLSQMNLLLKAGLNKTAKISKVEGKFGEAIDVVRSVSKPVGAGLSAVPAAAAAWAGICVALEVSLSRVALIHPLLLSFQCFPIPSVFFSPLTTPSFSQTQKMRQRKTARGSPRSFSR